MVVDIAPNKVSRRCPGNVPRLSLSQIRTLVNDETLRSILIDGDYDIPIEERTPYSPLESDRYLANLTADDMIEYRRLAINSDSTIHSYLRGMIYLYRRVVPEKLSSNDEPTMAKRLLFVRSLRALLTDDKYFFVFVDEMPFYPCEEKQPRCCENPFV